jgi:hypothetical protein
MVGYNRVPRVKRYGSIRIQTGYRGVVYGGIGVRLAFPGGSLWKYKDPNWLSGRGLWNHIDPSDFPGRQPMEA